METTKNEVVENVVENQEEVVVAKPKRSINRQKLEDNIWGWVFCLPLIIGTTVFVYFSFVVAVIISFSGYRFTTDLFSYLGKLKAPKDGVFANYADIFNGKTVSGLELNKYFGYTMFNTVFYLIGIPIGMALSLFFAVLMSRDIPGASVFRVIYYVPCVTSIVAIIFVFQKLFGSTSGFNKLFYGNNTQDYILWMDQAGQKPWEWGAIRAKIVLLIMTIWKGMGGTIVLYIAGLSGVNESHKEAASIDGANAWTTFWKIVVPQLWPTIFYNLVTAVIGGMQIYVEPELLFGSGTLYGTTGYVSLIVATGPFGSGSSPRVGVSCALGMVLAIIIFIMTMFQFYLDSKMDK